MGIAAIFTGTNAMFSQVNARTHEIGILLSMGFRPLSTLECLGRPVFPRVGGCTTSPMSRHRRKALSKDPL